MHFDPQYIRQNFVSDSSAGQSIGTHRPHLLIRQDSLLGQSGLEAAVRRARKSRQLRLEILGSDQYSGPAWEILLHLFESHLGQRRDTIGSIHDGIFSAPTTALRWIGHLEECGFISSREDPHDKRRRYVSLTAAGTQAMNEYFDALSAMAPHFDLAS